MLKSLLNNQTKSITGAAIILGAASLASRLLGLVRDRVLAHYFGAGSVMDAYSAAFKIPDLIYILLIGGALTVGFIPVFTKIYLRGKSNHQEAWKFVSNAINIFGLLLIVLTIIFIFLTPYLIPFLAPGFTGEKKELTILMTRVMFLSPLLLGFSAVVGGVLQSLKNFFIYSLSPIMYNLGIIVGVTILVPLFGLSGLAWGVVLGALFHLLVQLPAFFRTGFHFSFIFNLRDKSVQLMSRLILPRIMALAALQINMIVITAIASTLAAGSVAIFNYANNLQSFPLGIVGISFAVAAFPTLTALATENKKEEMIKNLSSTIRQILFFIIPLSIIFLMLRAQIVRVVLGSGAFDWEATVRTADSLAFFSLGLFAQALPALLVRAFYALEDTKTPFLIAVLTVAVNIFLSWYLTRNWLGVEGLALAYTLSGILNTILLWIFLRLRLGSLDEERILTAVYKISIAAIIMALTIQTFKTLIAPFVNMQTFLGVFLQGLTAGLFGLGAYILMGLLLKSHEMIVFVETIKKKFVQKKNLPTDISAIREV